MLRETGRIVEIKTVDGEKTAVVECVSKSACKSCGNSDECGVGVISKGSRNKVHQINMPYKEGMLVDESIELLIDNSDIIKSSLIVYVVPLLLFVTATTLGYIYLNNEPLVIGISIISLVIGVFIAKIISSKLYPRNQISQLITTE